MPILPLSYYPAPVLFQKGESVTEFDETLRKLAADMFATMYAAPGVGLAAQQVGISKRLFVMDCWQRSDPTRRLFVANPEIVYSEGVQNDYEGCLSVPGYSYKVRRAMNVTLKGQDLDGNEFVFDATELEARCVLHETDHCDGTLYVRRLSPLKRQEILRSIKKKIKAERWPFPELDKTIEGIHAL
jgi:peptide deformylase